MEGWWYTHKIGRNWSGVGLRDIVARFEGGETVEVGPTTIGEGEAEVMEGNPLAFVGVDAKYFSVAMLPQKTSLARRAVGPQTRKDG